MAKSGPDPGEGTSASPCRVGAVNVPGARRVRIVHISDTHLRHDQYRRDIPEGDILIHSGDFSHLSLTSMVFRERDYLSELASINQFFSGMPHKHKVFVCGNHDMNFEREALPRTERKMTHGVYLQDSMVTIEGIRIYGTPWNGLRKSYARGFTAPYSELHSFWSWIPGGGKVDVLVTHSPPGGILDQHIGSEPLRDEVLHRIRPKAHLFGHAHRGNGVKVSGDTLFSNAAMGHGGKAKIVDFYVDEGETRTELTPVHYAKRESGSKCSIM